MSNTPQEIDAMMTDITNNIEAEILDGYDYIFLAIDQKYKTHPRYEIMTSSNISSMEIVANISDRFGKPLVIVNYED